jgi:hypothetical protein
LNFFKVNSLLLVLSFLVLTACNFEKEKMRMCITLITSRILKNIPELNFLKVQKYLFAASAEFTGQFVLSGSGSAENPNIITTYDPKTKKIYRDRTENKAKINGLGKVEASVYLS